MAKHHGAHATAVRAKGGAADRRPWPWVNGLPSEPPGNDAWRVLLPRRPGPLRLVTDTALVDAAC